MSDAAGRVVWHGDRLSRWSAVSISASLIVRDAENTIAALEQWIERGLEVA